MSLVLCTALCLQALACGLMRWRLGQSWLTRPVGILVVTAVAYHGLSELLLAIPSIRGWDVGRLGVDQAYIDKAALVMSFGLLALVVGYLLTGPEQAAVPNSRDCTPVLRALDWRPFAVASAPLAILTYEGRGYNGALAASQKTVSTDLAATFLVILVVLAVFGFLGRYGMRWFVAGLIVQSVLLAAAGERLPVVAGAVALIVLLAHVRMRPSRRQVMLSRALTMAAVLGITGYRAASGRDLYHQNSGLTARMQAIGSGLYSLGQVSRQNGTSPGLVTEVAVRMDGNAFAGGVLQAMSSGRLVLGVGPVVKSVLIAVPSFVWSSKLVYLTGPSPVWTETYDFGLRATNYVPTLLALYIGFIGPYWLMIFLAVIGILCGWGEPWLFRRFTAVRTVVLAAVVEVVFKYEQGLPGMLVALRAVVVLALAVKLIEVAKREASRPSGKLARSHPDLLITRSYPPGSGGRR